MEYNDEIKGLKNFLALKKTTRPWHLPLVAGLCIGVPLLLGLYLDDIEAGKLASVGALVILYIQSDDLIDRLISLMICGFGFILSYSIGAIFSFGYFFPPLVLAVYTFGVHYSLFRLNLTRPPGNFFFTMVTCMAIATPKDVQTIASSVGNLALGVIIACTIGLIYSLLTLREKKNQENIGILRQNEYTNIIESIIFGATVGASLLVAKVLQMENPYWVPISCMAVMQRVSTFHVWERAIHRILGTVIGLGLTWLVLQFPLNIWQVCICIILLQTVVEFLVVRNYGLAAIFISMLTVFLAEPNIALTEHSGSLIRARLIDTMIGSAIGIIGGWMLYHEKIHFYTKKQLRKTKTIVKKIRAARKIKN